MSNHEIKHKDETVHLLLALRRNKFNEKTDGPRCLRSIIRDEALDLKLMEERIRYFGDRWRIHKTVNSRSVKKAYKILQHKLIDNPENCLFLDSLWRTCLLQKEAKAERYFMFDVDTKDKIAIGRFEHCLPTNYEIGDGYVRNIALIKKIETPNGFHYITHPFDTSEICKLNYVELLRDGYVFIKEIK